MRRYQEAVQRFKKVYQRAQRLGLNEPTATALATADSKGRPSVRIVLLKQFGKEGFVFYTNLRSRKGRQLAQNPRAALCFFWDPMMEQVIVEGKVVKVSDAQADAYWATRPRESQLASYASLQSQPLNSRRTLELKVKQLTTRFAGRSVPRPSHWGGFHLIPDRIEFWRAGPHRLNERLLYQKQGSRWRSTLLYP